MLLGGLVYGFVLATMLNSDDGTWGNAKKCTKKGALGDTVGLCLSLNILIKLMTMVSVAFSPVVVKFSPVIQGLLHITTK